MTSKNQDLDFALKYNWWTKSEDKDNIDLITKISYILSKWNLEELVFVFKNFSLETIKEAFDKIKNDNFSLRLKRKKVIENILNHKITL